MEVVELIGRSRREWDEPVGDVRWVNEDNMLAGVARGAAATMRSLLLVCKFLECFYGSCATRE